MEISKIYQNNLPRAVVRIGYLAVIVAGMILTPGKARADCSDFRNLKLGPAQKMQMNGVPRVRGNQSITGNSIVGLWHVIYTAQSQLFLETFDTWHADGTEFETANAAPALGSVCVGVWKQIGPRRVKLFHIGWNFNPDGSSAGYFTLTETNTVSIDGGSYNGAFDFKLYDVNGNLVDGSEVSGTMAATRIEVE